MRMVDTNALLSDIESAKAVAYVIEIGDINNLLYKNSVEAEPVKHGRWRVKHPFGEDKPFTVCSLCSYVMILPDDYFADLRNANYCPNCGARMDAKEE